MNCEGLDYLALMAIVYNTQQNGEALVSNEETRLFADMTHTDLQGICENHNKLIIMQNIFLLALNAFMEYSTPLRCENVSTTYPKRRISLPRLDWTRYRETAMYLFSALIYILIQVNYVLKV